MRFKEMCVGWSSYYCRSLEWLCILNLYGFFVATFQVVQKLFHSVKSLNLGQGLYIYFFNCQKTGVGKISCFHVRNFIKDIFFFMFHFVWWVLVDDLEKSDFLLQNLQKILQKSIYCTKNLTFNVAGFIPALSLSPLTYSLLPGSLYSCLKLNE